MLYILSAHLYGLSYPASKSQAPCYIDICVLPGSTIFFHIISQTKRFSEKKLLNIKCVFWISLQLLSEIFLILNRTARDIDVNVHRPLWKVSIILFIFYWNLNFLYRFSKSAQISNFVKIHPVGAEIFHADRPPDRRIDRHDEANSHFS
jgi:hypothetical protein